MPTLNGAFYYGFASAHWVRGFSLDGGDACYEHEPSALSRRRPELDQDRNEGFCEAAVFAESTYGKPNPERATAMRSPASVVLRSFRVLDALIVAAVFSLVWSPAFIRSARDLFLVLLIVPFFSFLFKYFGL